MRYLTLMMFLGGVLAAQTQNWRPPKSEQYFKQFKLAPGKNILAPGQKCAIRLLNALKKETTNDQMVVHPPPSNTDKISTVAPPAPSCDDVK